MSVTIRFDDREIAVRPGGNLVTALLDAGISPAFSCMAGVCQTCMVKVESGAIPAAAQAGIRDTLASQGMALACRLPVGDGLVVRRPGRDARTRCRVISKTSLNSSIWRLLLSPDEEFDYIPGQYLTLWNPAGAGRAYSIASHPAETDFIELHIRSFEGGIVSSWVASELKVGVPVEVSGPAGVCHYLPGNPDRPMILAGTGTGLAPLLGIVRDALHNEHRGGITLMHEARSQDDFYLVDELRELAASNPQLEYIRACRDEPVGKGDPFENVIELVSASEQPKIYLCGGNDFVHGLRKRLFLAGVNLADILADVFLPAQRSRIE